MPAVVAAAPSAAAEPAPEQEMPPLQQHEEDEPSSISSSSEDEGDFKVDRKRKKANARSKLRPPPALRWMRTPLNANPDNSNAASSNSFTPASVPLSRVLGLDPRIAAHLREKLGFDSLLPVQAAVWAASAGGRAGAAHDLAVAAPTGSGKTLAYGLPLLHSLLDDGYSSSSVKGGKKRGGKTKKEAATEAKAERGGAASSTSLGALVVVPTRDLAEQVAAVLGPRAAAWDCAPPCSSAEPAEAGMEQQQQRQQEQRQLKATSTLLPSQRRPWLLWEEGARSAEGGVGTTPALCCLRFQRRTERKREREKGARPLTSSSRLPGGSRRTSLRSAPLCLKKL